MTVRVAVPRADPPGPAWVPGYDDFDLTLRRLEHRRCNRATRAHEAKRRTRKGRVYGVTGAEQGRSDIPEDPDKPTMRASGTSCLPDGCQIAAEVQPDLAEENLHALIGARARGPITTITQGSSWRAC